MIVRSFRSVIWVGAVAGAALSCYMVSLRVASERAGLERVESRILAAKRDIRSLDTELVTRGRIRQLERWNVEVLALAAPTEAQFLEGEVQLAGLTRVDPLVAPPMFAPGATDAAPRDAGSPDAKSPDEGRTMLAAYRPERAAKPAAIVRAHAAEPAQAAIATLRTAKPVRTARADAKPAAKIKLAAREPTARGAGGARPGATR